MSWNYRIVKRKYNNEEYFGIYEAYYNKSGNIYAISENPQPVISDSMEGLFDVIYMHRKAFSKVILDYDNIKFDEED